MYYYKLGKIVLVIVVFICLGACNDELLNPVPKSTLTSKNAFTSANEINLGVLGIYSMLSSRVPTDYELISAAGDNSFGEYFAVSPGLDEIVNLSVSSDNDKINNYWKANYNIIFRANDVLANIDVPTDYSGSEKSQYEGEAKFLRAKAYFDLVRIFGGVPKVTKILTVEESKDVPRASIQEVYDQIVQDLRDAVSKLPDPEDIDWGRASKGAAVALLAKVYIFLEDWDNANKYFDELFNKFDYQLVSNYGDLFNVETEQNSEAIFSLAYTTTKGQSLTDRLAPLQGIYKTIQNGDRVIRPTYSLRKAFDKADSRLPVTISDSLRTFAYKPGDPALWWPYFNKWIVPDHPRNQSNLDIPVIRLGGMKLLYSEVLFHLNRPVDALKQINEIRERAFGDNSHDYKLSDISTKEQFYDKFLNERRLELATENHRWFDLVRTGRFVKVLKSFGANYSSVTGEGVVIKKHDVKEYMKYFPIPDEQIRLAHPGVIEQNEGY